MGDLHGDLGSLLTILEDRGLIDRNGAWRGERTHLVLLGDLVGGHKDSRLLIDFVMKLETEARRANGRLHALLGNQDLLPCRGEIGKMASGERKRYDEHLVPGAPGEGAKRAFRGESIYAKWVAGRNAVVRISDTLFIHAGINTWGLEADFGRVNATVRAWIRHWQNAAPKPEKSTRWAFGFDDDHGELSPLWMRSFKVRSKTGDDRPEGGPSRKTVRAILEKFGLRRIVLGHAPVPEKEILLEHPYYGESVLLADTRLSNRKRGRLSAVEIIDGRVSVAYPRRRDEEHPLLEQHKAAYQ